MTLDEQILFFSALKLGLGEAVDFLHRLKATKRGVQDQGLEPEIELEDKVAMSEDAKAAEEKAAKAAEEKAAKAAEEKAAKAAEEKAAKAAEEKAAKAAEKKAAKAAEGKAAKAAEEKAAKAAEEKAAKAEPVDMPYSRDDLRASVQKWANAFSSPQWVATIMTEIAGTYKLNEVAPAYYGSIIAELERAGVEGQTGTTK